MVVSLNSEAAKKGDNVLDVTSTLNYQFIKTDDMPNDSSFITLKSGESYVVDTEDFVPVYDNTKAHANFLKPGDYVLQSTILTWGGPSKLGEELKSKWEHLGVLWLKPLVTEPMPFSIDRSPLITGCNSD